ncbi:MAG: transposase [Lachnospiraceae bacterium]|nr:transposase [Lachnospiraceae bacterium]
MPRTARKLSNSGYYHVISRGNGKQILFEEDADRHVFLGILKKIRKEEGFDVIAYCLMENHFHLLIRADDGLDHIMKRINTTYAVYSNSKYDRVGHLFQDRFMSVPVESDAALLSVIRYIHNNPAKAGICAADRYPWSSWNAYVKGSDFVSTDLVLELCGGLREFLYFSGREDAAGTQHLEVKESEHLKDRTAQRIIQERLHLKSGTQLQALPRAQRDSALWELKKAGLSIRQIERLTGVSRGVVQKVCSARKKMTEGQSP